MTVKLRIKVACPECGGANLLRDQMTGELTCRTCGLVISSAPFNREPEWRAFDQEQRDKLPRVGAPETWTIHDKGLSTNIGWQDRDASGGRLSPEARYQLYRLRKWHRRSKVSDSTQHNLAHALGEMGRISYKLNLPRNVMETAAVNYRTAAQRRFVRGRPINGLVVACVYMACRQCGVVRTLEEVAEAAGMTKKDAARNYRCILRKLRSTVPQVDPQDCIGRIVNKLALTGETERLAKVILCLASDMKLTGGRGPSGMAAACVYISTQLTDDRITQGEIAKEARVTEVTIRNRYKELVRRMEFSVQV